LRLHLRRNEALGVCRVSSANKALRWKMLSQQRLGLDCLL
jgi:hypothetical protein